jgi:poly(glycerol-phosphate) alpha-glucosyltransferase
VALAVVEPERLRRELMGVRFPEANYFIAGSRLRPGLDGGYTVSALRRAQQFSQYAGVDPVLLTFDFWPDYEQVVAEFSRLGLMTERTVVRNLLQDARTSPSFLREAAAGQEVPPGPAGAVAGETELDARGTPWRTVFTDAQSGSITHTDFLDVTGRPVLRVPYVTGRADWHRAPISITVFGDDGTPDGWLDGFGALYRAWMRHVIDTSPAGRTNVVVCESRQVGELLVDLPGDDLRLVHTVHSAHTSTPYRWDSPIDGLWASWLDVVDRFDAVIWPTATQRRAVERRFGARDNFWVVPHAVEVAASPESRRRDPDVAVMIGRLVPLKRLDHALRAFQQVVRANPRARLEVYGDGPDEHRLRSLATDLGIERSVQFRGHQPDAAASLAESAALVLTSTYEGQPLVILEALAHGCPVVSYDINFGPADMVVDGENGILVPDGDIAAMADALGSVLGNPERVAELSAGAHASALGHAPEHSMLRMAELFDAVVARPRSTPRWAT